MTDSINLSLALDPNQELSLDDLDLVLGGGSNAVSAAGSGDDPQQQQGAAHAAPPATPSGDSGFEHAVGNIGNGAGAGGVTGIAIGAGLGFLGGGPAGALAGAEIGGMVGGVSGGAFMAGREAYQAGAVEAFQHAAAVYQANPPPI